MTSISPSNSFKITETFFSVDVANMERATAFYSMALGTTVLWTSPRWSSLQICGVRVGLLTNSNHSGTRIGLHFAVTDLDAACASAVKAGGRIVSAAMQVAPNVFVAEVSDTEGNIFSFRKDL